MKNKPIFAVALFLLMANTLLSQEPIDGAKITYVANEGFMVQTAKHKVLVDAIFGNINGDWCDQPGDSTLNLICSGKAPYDNIDLLLVSHYHLDHFNTPMVIKFLSHNPHAAVVCPEQVLEKMKKDSLYKNVAGRIHSLKADTMLDMTMTIHNITVRAMRLKHGSWLMKDTVTGKSYDIHKNVENIGYLVDSDHFRFLHTGDCETDDRYQFERLKLSATETDVAFLGIGFLSSEGQSVMTNNIRSKKIVLMHITPGKAEYYRSIVKDYPEFVIFDKPGESTVIHSILASQGQISPLTKIDSAIITADTIISNDPRESFKNVESFIVFQNGAKKFEKYYHGFVKDSLYRIQSQTKSITALLMGIAIDKGFIKSEDELVSRFYPEYFGPGDTLKSRIRIRDLLTMSAGFKWEEMLPQNDPGNDNANMYRTWKWLQYALSRPMAHEPSTVFKYNSGCPMIVAGIIEKSTKMRLDDFAKRYLFDPLGIKTFRWLKDSTGLCHAGGGLRMKPMDMIKIGTLVLNNGRWEGVQVISESWVEKATTPYIKTNFENAGYGYYWWIRDMKIRNGRTTKMIAAEGAGGQRLYIFPEYALIIGFTEQNYSTPTVGAYFINEGILPVLD